MLKLALTMGGGKMSKRWVGLLVLFIFVAAVSFFALAQQPAPTPLAWREAVFAILITAVVLAGLVGYEYVRKRKAE